MLCFTPTFSASCTATKCIHIDPVFYFAVFYDNIELQPDRATIEANGWWDELKRPMMLLVKARKSAVRE